jgi:two-component system response regulator RegX3
MDCGRPAPVPSVLIVNDEPATTDVLRAFLHSEGFGVHVAGSGDEARRSIARAQPDLVLLDLSLPTMSGVAVFHAIRARADIPVIMVTGRVDEIDTIVGLELGADDAIGKPFHPREVVARVKAVLRRTSGQRPAPPVIARFGDIEFDISGHEVRRAGRPINVTPTEFRILKALISGAGRAFTRAQLLDAITDDRLDIYDRTLDRHIANVRHKIEPDPTHPTHIVTVFGVGYKFVGT